MAETEHSRTLEEMHDEVVNSVTLDTAKVQRRSDALVAGIEALGATGRMMPDSVRDGYFSIQIRVGNSIFYIGDRFTAEHASAWSLFDKSVVYGLLSAATEVLDPEIDRCRS